MLHHYYLHIYSHLVHVHKKPFSSPFSLSHFRSVHAFKCVTRKKSSTGGRPRPPPPPFFWLTVDMADSWLQNGPARISDSHSSTVIFLLPSESHIIKCNYCFCDNLLLYFVSYTDFVFKKFDQNSNWTASASPEVVPMEYRTSVKEASTKVIVAKMVIIINLLAAIPR